MRVVFLVGGPLDGQGFDQKDWQERVRAAEAMVEKGQRPAPALGYRLGKMADLTRRLPAVLTDAIVDVWVWRRT